MKVFLSFLLGALTSSTGLLAQSAKMISTDSDLSLSQYSNINGYQPKLMMNPGELANLQEGVEAVLGLEEFRQAVAAHPAAERLVIHREDGIVSIRPSDTAQDVGGIDQDENREIINQLRAVLPAEFSDPLLRDQISSNNSGIQIDVDPLSSVRLREIIEKLDCRLCWEELADSDRQKELQSAQAALQAAFEKQQWGACRAWKKVIKKTEQASKSWNTASEALAQGNLDKAFQWRKVAEQLNTSAEKIREIAQIYSLGDAKKAKLLERAAPSTKLSDDQLQSISLALEKAKGATEQGNLPLAELWQKSSVQHQKLAEHYRQAVEVILSGNAAERLRFFEAASSAKLSDDQLKSAFLALEKVRGATEQGNLPLAELWKKSAVQYQETAEHWFQATAAKSQGNKVEYDRYAEAATSAKSSSDQLELAIEAFGKTTTARTQGNATIETAWEKVTTQHQKSADYDRRAAEARKEGNVNNASCFTKAANFTLSSAKQLRSAVEAVEKENTARMQGDVVMTTAWEKVAIQHQTSADYYRRAAEASETRNSTNTPLYTDNETRLIQAACSASSSADHLRLAASVLKKATETTEQGYLPLADLWRKSAVQYQEFAEEYYQASLASVTGNAAERLHFAQAANNADFCTRQLSSASSALNNAITATKQDNLALAELWAQIVLRYQQSAEYRATATRASENSTLAVFLGKASSAAMYSASRLQESIWNFERARETPAADQDRIDSCNKIALQQQEAAEYAHKAASAFALGNDVEGERWDKAGWSAVRYNKELESADRAIRVSSSSCSCGQCLQLKDLRKTAAKLHKESSDYYRQALEAYTIGNASQGTILYQRGVFAGTAAEKAERDAQRLL